MQGASSIPVWALILVSGFGAPLVIMLLTAVLLSSIAFISIGRIGRLAHGDFVNICRLIYPGLLRAGVVILGVVIAAFFYWWGSDNDNALKTALYGSLLAITLLVFREVLTWIGVELQRVRRFTSHLVPYSEHLSDVKPSRIDIRRRAIAVMLTVSGFSGMIYFTKEMPSDYSLVFEMAKWAFGMTASALIAFAAIPAYGNLTSRHLKIIDLVWVLASALAVVFSVIQVAQLYADAERASIVRNVDLAREKAKGHAYRAFQEQCVRPSLLSGSQCEVLNRIRISLDVGGYLSPILIGSLCPRPIDLSSPPRAFSGNLIEVCIQAGYVAYSEDIPVLKDKENVEIWHQKTSLWPFWMIFLVALRVMKSVAEVFGWIKDLK